MESEDRGGGLVTSAQAQGEMRPWLSLVAYWVSPIDAHKKVWWPVVRSFRPKVPSTDGGLERSPAQKELNLPSAILPLESHSFG